MSGKTVVVPGSYHRVNPSYVSYGTLFSVFYNAIVKAASLIAFVFVCGGAFGIITDTGAISSGLNRLIGKLGKNEGWFIAIVMLMFCVGGASYGMAEETIPFVAMMVAIAIKMGFDPIVGVSMVIIGVYCGYSGGALNPFNTGIAQAISELPTFSGIGLRIVLSIGALIIAIHHVTSYGKQYKKKVASGEIAPSFEDNAADPALTGEIRDMTSADKIILGSFLHRVLVFGVLVSGLRNGSPVYDNGHCVDDPFQGISTYDESFMEGAKGMAGTVWSLRPGRFNDGEWRDHGHLYLLAFIPAQLNSIITWGII